MIPARKLTVRHRLVETIKGRRQALKVCEVQVDREQRTRARVYLPTGEMASRPVEAASWRPSDQVQVQAR